MACVRSDPKRFVPLLGVAGGRRSAPASVAPHSSSSLVEGITAEEGCPGTPKTAILSSGTVRQPALVNARKRRREETQEAFIARHLFAKSSSQDSFPLARRFPLLGRLDVRRKEWAEELAAFSFDDVCSFESSL